MKTVEEIINGFRKDVKESHQKYIYVPREDIEVLVDYFDDLDEFNDIMREA